MQKSLVALVRCNSYEPEELYRAVLRGLDLVGGAGIYARKGEKILLKPNILNGSDPNRCVVTHPNVLAAVTRAFQKTGARLSYGDSPCVESTQEAARKAGFEKVADELNLPLSDFENSVSYKSRRASFFGSFPLAKAVVSSDGLISISKLKTHNFTRITGAVKNQYGCISGLRKAQYHARFPMVQEFARFVVDVCAAAGVRLYIMDAIMAMEGDGPNNGTPRKLGVLLMSTDPVALDATACRLINLDPSMVPTNTAGKKAGLGEYEAAMIKVVGDSLQECVDNGFTVVRKPPFSVYAHGLRKHLQTWLVPRPVIARRKCIKCGRCVHICPVEPKAIEWLDGRKKPPRHLYSRCIRCFCCQEACPAEAISIKTSLPGRIFPAMVEVMFPVVRNTLHLIRRLKKKQEK
ncbi:MAG: DUF362 domain-containing protein [Fibrobacterota bacterium]